MARNTDNRLLDTGDKFPSLKLNLTQGGTLDVPGSLKAPFKVVLVNRGGWCPFCTGQLRSFQAHLDKLKEAGIDVVSASTDTKEQAQDLISKNDLSFAVGYGANIEEYTKKLGLFYDAAAKVPHLQSAGFVVGPDNNVLVAVYSSGAIGRLAAPEVIGMVNYIKSEK